LMFTTSTRETTQMWYKGHTFDNCFVKSHQDASFQAKIS